VSRKLGTYQDDWVLDMDIRGFFDALDHHLVMRTVSKYTQCKWTLLEIKRWLNADVIMPNGELIQSMQGTPQGSVIGPLLANIFFHLGFDKWMQKEYSYIHFERYADNIVVHCRSEKQLKFIEELARAINPIIQGWINYYGQFRKSSMSTLYDYINSQLINWAKRKYKNLQRRQWRAGKWLRGIYLISHVVCSLASMDLGG
jgi:retron-type reverse transcriptase